MDEVINFVLEQTEACAIKWKRLMKAPKVTPKENVLSCVHLATGVKGASHFFLNSYIALRGQKKVICLVIVDMKGEWHFFDATKGEVGQKIEETFSCFFTKRDTCHVSKKSRYYGKSTNA